MEKTDLAKLYKSYHTAKSQPSLIEIGKAQFLSITGKGDPSSPLFTEKIQALYSAAYAVKFRYKERSKDFTVAKLEGLWWFDESRFGEVKPAEAPRKIPRNEWEYRLLIRLPDFVDEKEMKAAIGSIMEKKAIPHLDEVEFYIMHEGTAVQIMHTGPFDKEPETLQLMQEFMEANQLVRNGLHHEIYLSDFRRTAPEKLKTILREPCRRK